MGSVDRFEHGKILVTQPFGGGISSHRQPHPIFTRCLNRLLCYCVPAGLAIGLSEAACFLLRPAELPWPSFTYSLGIGTDLAELRNCIFPTRKAHITQRACGLCSGPISPLKSYSTLSLLLPRFPLSFSCSACFRVGPLLLHCCQTCWSEQWAKAFT